MRRLMLNLTVCGAAMLVFTGVPAFAQPMANDREVQASGGFFHAQGSGDGSVNGTVGFGYYLTNPAWQVGAQQGLSYQFIDHGPNVWTATTTPYVNYHFLNLFQNPGIVPYAGGFVGAVWNDEDITGTVGPTAGVKFFLSDQVFLVTQYRYEWFFDDLSLGGVGDNSSDGNHVGTIGLGFVWGGDERVTSAAYQQRLNQTVERATKQVENAAARADNAAKSAALAAEKTDAAARRMEGVAAEAEHEHNRRLRK